MSKRLIKTITMGAIGMIMCVGAGHSQCNYDPDQCTECRAIGDECLQDDACWARKSKNYTRWSCECSGCYGGFGAKTKSPREKMQDRGGREDKKER